MAFTECSECGRKFDGVDTVQYQDWPMCDVCHEFEFHEEEFEASWDEPAFIWYGEEIYLSYEGECNMCGKERPVNDKGYCSSCWQVWNS